MCLFANLSVQITRVERVFGAASSRNPGHEFALFATVADNGPAHAVSGDATAAPRLCEVLLLRAEATSVAERDALADGIDLLRSAA